MGDSDRAPTITGISLRLFEEPDKDDKVLKNPTLNMSFNVPCDKNTGTSHYSVYCCRSFY